MSLTLETKLAILQQSEYEWRHYLEWKRNNPGYAEKIVPKKWTTKLSILRLIAQLLRFFFREDVSLQIGITFLAFPQKVITFCILTTAIVKLRWLQWRGLRVITVCGSYAKTSTKMILSHVLQGKFNVHATPGNINRSLGIAREIFSNLNTQTEFFIVEMGEYDRGDIAHMTRMVRPAIAVVTPITMAHLERFKDLQEIETEIFDVFRFSSAQAFVHERNSDAFHRQQIKSQITTYGSSMLREVYTSRAGTEYSVEALNTQMEFFIPLFGVHNAENTLPAVLIALQVGMNESEIRTQLSILPFVPHRLEPTVLEHNILLLDNGYNSNPESARQSLHVLKDLEGSQKIVTTPGFVELGSKQETENIRLGQEIAKVADICVVIKSINLSAILHGLSLGKMDPDVIYTASDEGEAMRLLTGKIKPNAVILFENSVPELYAKS